MATIKAPFDEVRTYSSMTDFLEKNGNRVIRFWVYKRLFTPLEQDKKYIDQGCFEDNESRAGVIREVITLPDNDLLLGIAELCEDINDLLSDLRCLEYFKLSELRISFFPRDEVEYGLAEADSEVGT